MRRFVVEVYEDNDITEQEIHVELLCRFGNMIAGVTEEVARKEIIMEQELVNALQSLRQAFETNVRDCEEWVQYRNAVAALRHAAQQSVQADGAICPDCKELFSNHHQAGGKFFCKPPRR